MDQKIYEGLLRMNAKRIMILSFVIAMVSILFLSSSIYVKGEGFSLTKIGQFEECYFAFDDSVFVRENIVFVADYFNGVYIYNAVNPSNLQQIGHYSNGNEIGFVVCKDDLACIGDPFLSILNISDLATPIEIFRDGNFPVIDVIIRDDILFCLDLFQGLIILNISNPTSPVQVNQWLTTGINYRDIEIHNDVIFLAGSTGLKALDISDLTDIQDLGVDLSGETVRSLAIENNLLYITEANTDLVIYNITNLDIFNEIGHHTENGIVINSIFVANNLIYATAESDGLIIFGNESNGSTNEASFASIFIGLLGMISLCIRFLQNKKQSIF
jgi:hypothetical protein